MNETLQSTGFGYAASAEQRNRVLRNTYWLLAISLVPTVLGAWIGVSTGVLFALSPGISLVLFLAVAFGLMFGIEKTKNSSTGIVLLLAFTFFMGLMLSRLLAFVLGFSNGGRLVMLAFGGTALTFGGMATLATSIKRDVAGLGKWLMVGAIMLLVAMLANFFLQSSALMITLSVIAVGLFSAFMLYDIKRVVDGGESNYISATLAIYLDTYNVFQNLLMLLGIFGGERNN